MEPGWHVNRSIGGQTEVADFRLRPIRDNDGEDETLTWAGKPETAAIERALGCHVERAP